MTPWAIQSVEFSRPEYWSGEPFPSPGDLPNPGMESRSPTLQADSLPAEPQGSPRILEWVAYPFFRGSSRSRSQPGSPALRADSLPTELSGKSSTSLTGSHRQSCGEPAPPSRGLAQVQSTHRVHKQLCSNLVLPSSRWAPDQARPGHVDSYTRLGLGRPLTVVWSVQMKLVFQISRPSHLLIYVTFPGLVISPFFRVANLIFC